MAKYTNTYENKVVITGEEQIRKLASALEAEKENAQRLQSSLESARDTVRDLYNQIDSLKSASGIDILEEELDRFRDTAKQSLNEFKTFLESVNLNDAYGSNDYKFDDLFRQIKDGSMTAQQAIAQVKTEFSALMEENYSAKGGLFDTQQVQAFTATLNSLSETVGVVVNSLQRIESEGVKTSGSVSGSGANITEMLSQIADMSENLSKKAAGSIDSIQKMVSSLTEYASVDTTKLLGVSQAFKNIADITKGGKVSNDTVENIVYLAKQLTALNSSGATGIRFDFSGLSGLKVSKASLSNLAEYLPRISESGIASLKRLSEINFSNLSEFKVSKASVDNLSKLVDVEQLGKILNVLEQFSQSMTAATQKVTQETGSTGKAISAEGTQVNALSDAYGKHASAVSSAAEAERKKKTVSDEVGNALREESYSTDQATESARQHDRALKTVVDTLSNVKTRMHDLAGKEGGTNTKEYADLQNLEQALEQLRAKADGFSAKHISDEMVKLQLSFSEAKLGANVFSMGVSDSAKASAEAFAKASDSVKKYYELLNNLNKNRLAKEDIRQTDTGTYESRTGKYAELAAEINAASEQFKKFTSAEEMAKMSGEDQLRIIGLLEEAHRKYSLAVEASNGKQSAAADNADWKQALSEVKATYDQLVSIQKEMSGKQLELIKLDPAKNAEEIKLLEQEIAGLQQEYDKLFNSANTRDFSTEQFKNLARLIDETKSKIEHFKAKETDLANSFAKGLTGGKAGIEYEGLVKQFEALTSASPRLVAAMEQLKAAQATLTTSSDPEQMVQAYRDYLNVLGDVKAMLSDETQQQQQRVAQEEQMTQLIKDRAEAQERLNNMKKGGTKDALTESFAGMSSELDDLNAKWDKLSGEERKQKLDELAQKFKELNGEINKAGKNGGPDQLKMLESRFVYMFSLANVIMKLVREIKQMISTSVELDTAMTQLRIVTQGSQNDFDAYGSVVAKTAKNIGASITDLIDSTTTFARLGYSLVDASELARVSSMLSNVGAIDVSTTQSALTAITKAFGISAEEIESVMDKLVTVGNNFPISVAELAEGLNNAGSALAAAGNSFEQSVALLTAANTTVQNISKASTGLRTITARIRSTKTELDELGEAIETSKYEEVINVLTQHNVLITDANGEYRSTYDILRDIAAIWGKLSSMEQAAIAEQLAGNRQQNVFYSIIEQFQEANNAMEAMGSSTGALQRSYDVYLESVEAKSKRLKATFQELSASIFDSNSMGGFLDVVNFLFDKLAGLLGFLNEIHVLLPLLASTIGLLLLPAIKKAAIAWVSAFSSIKLGAFAIASVIGVITSVIVGELRRAEEARKQALQAAQQASRDTRQSRDDRKATVDKSIERIYELKESMNSGTLSTAEFYDAQAELVSIKGDLVGALGEEATAIDLVGSSADDAAERLRKLNDEASITEANEFIHSNRSGYEQAREALYGDEYGRNALGFGIEVGDIHSTYFNDGYDGYVELYKELGNLLDKYNSLDLHHSGSDIFGFIDTNYSMSVVGDIHDAREELTALYDELELLKKKYNNDPRTLERITYIQSQVSAGISEINGAVDEYEGIYTEWQISTIIANDAYRKVYNQFIGAQKDYEKAIHGQFDTEEEQEAAINAALENMDAAKSLLYSTDFSNDPDAKKYIEEQIAAFEKAANKSKQKIRIRGQLDLEVNYADGKAGKYGDVLAGLLRNFAGEDGSFRMKTILDVAAVVEDKEALVAAGKDVEWTSQELAYIALRNAAKMYGLEVEDLIDILGELGVVSVESANGLSKTIDQVTGLSDKIDGATARVEAFNKAMEGGEKGDAAAGYASVYDKFIKDWDAGKTGSNAVAAAIDAFLSPEIIAQYGADIDKLGELLSGPLYRAIFTDGEDYGLNFVNYIRDTYGDAVDGIYQITSNEDGSFSISISDFEKLAGLLEMDSDLFYALADSMDLWGTEIMADDKMVQKLAEDIGLIGKNAPVDNMERINAAISALYDKGVHSPTQLVNMLKLLADAGYIEFDIEADSDKVMGAIQDIITEKQELAEQGTKVTIDSNAPEVISDIQLLTDAINNIPRAIAINIGIPQWIANGGKNWTGKPGVFDSIWYTATGHANGTKDAVGGPTLVNELGPELISENGRAYIAGGGKPTVVDLDPHAIVIPADETKRALGGVNRQAKQMFHAAAGGYSYYNTKYCPHCGTANPKTRNKCVACGFSFTDASYKQKYCPHCGVANPIERAKCIACGYEFASSLAPETGQTSSAPNSTLDATFGSARDKANNQAGSGGSGGSGSGGSGSGGSNWFEEQYAEHKHLVEMDKENIQDFLDWLDDAYKRAYEEGIIDLKEYRQHEEEVYKGRQDDFKDHLNDIEHLIGLEENGQNDPTVIYNYYVQMMADIEKELEKAYAYGLDATNEYVQYLQNTWNKYNKEIKDRQEDANNDAKKQVKDLVDYRIKMLKQYLKNEIQTLKDRLSYLKDFYSKQKELLQDERDEEKYIDEQAEKRKTVSDIQAELAQLENDNSAWAQKRKKKLQEELAKAQKALDDFEKDHALKVAQDQLDAIYEAQEKDIDAQIDALEEKLNDPKYLYEQALEDVRNNSVALYEEMIEFNNKYGTGIQQDIVDMWEEAYISLKRYFDLYGEYYKGINLVNATGYVPDDNYNNIIVAHGGGYASGTTHATRGLHRVDELGAEYVFTSKNGNRYRMLGEGDLMLDAKSSGFLYRFATAGRSILEQLIGGGRMGGLGLAGAGGGVTEIRMGDIIIHGNADERTVSEIRRAQREGINTILKEFNRLRK